MIRDVDQLQRKMLELQEENRMLKAQINASRTQKQSSHQQFLDIQWRNERLEREAVKYQQSLKEDLSQFMQDSFVHGDCFYRNRYECLLRQPKNNYKLYF